MKAFRKINTNNWELDQVQTNVEQVLTPIATIPQNDGAAIRQVKLLTGINRIAQPLTRKPLGWYVTDKDTTADIYRSAWDSRTVTLVTDNDVTVDIWIF